MKSSRRIVINTAVTYARSILSLGLALFSSRWVLQSIGQIDYGIYSVVGSVIVFITFLSNVMAGSVGRHYAFAIGQEKPEEINRWFITAFRIHLLLAIVLTLIGWTIGEYLIGHTLNIPAARIVVSLTIYRASLVSAFVSILSVPFVAMFIARQSIAQLSVWGLLQSVLSFILAYNLTIMSGDRLLFYAIGMVGIIVFIQTSLMLHAYSFFRECNFRTSLRFDTLRLKEIISFAVWTLIGSLGGTLRDQGSVLLLNIYFGPKVNAAYGLANQVSVQTNQLSAAMLGAFAPEICSSEGRGDRGRMLTLSLMASKIGTMLIALFAVPLIIEMDYVLKIWLVDPPIYTALFCRLILCTLLIDRLSAGYMLAVSAYGRIAAYQATIGTIMLFSLPLAWLFLKFGYPPTSVGTAFIITMSFCTLGRVLWVQRLFGLPASRWFSSVMLPCCFVALSAMLFALLPHYLVPPSIIRLILVTVVSGATSGMVAWYVALEPGERAFIGQRWPTKSVQRCKEEATTKE